MKSMVVWDVMTCSLETGQRFRSYHLHFQGKMKVKQETGKSSGKQSKPTMENLTW
jgi:hypothetical protein